MLGAISGDVIGSIYEFDNFDGTWEEAQALPLLCERSHFTDDSVLTCAVAEALMRDRDYEAAYRRWFDRYPDAGYGGMFYRWARNRLGPYGSFGNGSAMRVSPIGWAFQDLWRALDAADLATEPTHNHVDSLIAARAVVAAIHAGREGDDLKASTCMYYDLDEPIESIHAWYEFDGTATGTVPIALRCVIEAQSWEEAIRKALWVGGDTDTICAIAGSIAEAYWPIPQEVIDGVAQRLPNDMRQVVHEFYCRYREGVISL